MMGKPELISSAPLVASFVASKSHLFIYSVLCSYYSQLVSALLVVSVIVVIIVCVSIPGRAKTFSGRKRHSIARMSVLGGRADHSPLMIKKANSCSTIYTDDSTVSLSRLSRVVLHHQVCMMHHMVGNLHYLPPGSLLLLLLLLLFLFFFPFSLLQALPHIYVHA